MVPFLLGLVVANACPREGLSLLQLRVNQTSGYDPLIPFPEAAASWCRFGDELPYWTVVGKGHDVALPCKYASQCSDFKSAVEAHCKVGIGAADCAEGTTGQVHRGMMLPSNGLAGTSIDGKSEIDGQSDSTHFDYQGHSLICEDFPAAQESPRPLLGAAAPSAPLPPEPDWTLVFRQTVGDYDWPALRKNADNPNADNYAILDELERFRGQDGKFKFKLEWDGVDDGPQIWKQSSNPTTSEHPVQGYEEVDNKCNSAKRWAGLALAGTTAAKFDGTPGNWWWYAVMSTRAFRGGIPACSGPATKTELYVWNENPAATAQKALTVASAQAPKAIDTGAAAQRATCTSHLSSLRSTLPKSKNAAFQKKSWDAGCKFAEEEGDLGSCKSKCRHAGGCCGTTCRSNSCSGGGCCGASKRICEKACENFFVVADWSFTIQESSA